jgi:hypothetical protein
MGKYFESGQRDLRRRNVGTSQREVGKRLSLGNQARVVSLIVVGK